MVKFRDKWLLLFYKLFHAFAQYLIYISLNLTVPFPSIGKISYVKEASGYIAGYKLQLLTIFQNVSQLNEIYGMQGRKTLLANHSCKIVFAPNEQDDTEYFSNEIAYTTTYSVSESRNHGRGPTAHSESANQAKRPLMLPQELKQMPFKEEIVLRLT